MGMTCSTNGKRNAYRILVGKPEGTRPRRRWVGNINSDHREIVWDRVDWIDLAQDRDWGGGIVNTAMKLLVP
jgi:hypothetical protein